METNISKIFALFMILSMMGFNVWLNSKNDDLQAELDARIEAGNIMGNVYEVVGYDDNNYIELKPIAKIVEPLKIDKDSFPVGTILKIELKPLNNGK